MTKNCRPRLNHLGRDLDLIDDLVFFRVCQTTVYVVGHSPRRSAHVANCAEQGVDFYVGKNDAAVRFDAFFFSNASRNTAEGPVRADGFNFSVSETVVANPHTIL